MAVRYSSNAGLIKGYHQYSRLVVIRTVLVLIDTYPFCQYKSHIVIFHIPHSSFDIPVDLRPSLLLDDSALLDELRVMTDAFLDDLFGGLAGPEDTVVGFPVSRLIVDPERFLDEMQEMMAWIGMGVIYTKTSTGEPLRDYPTLDERDALIRRFYLPHHKQLNEITAAELQRCDAAFILDCHSYPSTPLPYELDQDSDRPDICLGTHLFHTPSGLIEIAQRAVAAEGLTCGVNKPFDGCLVPSRYYEQDQRVSGLMIELKRSLYMDEATGKPSDQYEDCRKAVARIVEKLRQAAAPAASPT